LRRFDSVTAARRKPLPQPLGNYTGRFEHPGYGAIAFTERDGRLWYEFGAYDGPADIYDASKNQFRIELGGSGWVIGFVIGTDGRAQQLALDGNTFTRVARP
jgi:hypothetical protein